MTSRCASCWGWLMAERNRDNDVTLLRDALTLAQHIESLRADLEVDGLLVLQVRLYPVDLEAALVRDVNLPYLHRNAETIAVGDPQQVLLLGEALDVVH